MRRIRVSFVNFITETHLNILLFLLLLHGIFYYVHGIFPLCDALIKGNAFYKLQDNVVCWEILTKFKSQEKLIFLLMYNDYFVSQCFTLLKKMQKKFKAEYGLRLSWRNSNMEQSFLF